MMMILYGLDIIPGDDVAVSVESLATKYPIVDWKTHVLSEDKRSVLVFSIAWLKKGLRLQAQKVGCYHIAGREDIFLDTQEASRMLAGGKLEWITSITVNGKNAYELKGKFLDDLHKNAFSGTNGEDAVEHIEYFLKIVDPIDLPNVNQDKLRVVVFPISLVGDAWRWFDGIKGSITSWVDLTGNFFRKYYPPSRTGRINNPIIKWDPTNPKFENWLASKFVNYKTMDIFTKGALWDYWKLGSDEIKPTNDETSDLEETDHDDEQEIGEIFRIETNLREDRYCNGGNLPGAYIIGNSLHYQDYEWYEALKDGELKEEALRNKAIMEGTIDDDDESRPRERNIDEYWWRIYKSRDLEVLET
ncbi:hypothetical protein Tco_0573992 [Tanacetum coccineum]